MEEKPLRGAQQALPGSPMSGALRAKATGLNTECWVQAVDIDQQHGPRSSKCAFVAKNVECAVGAKNSK